VFQNISAFWGSPHAKAGRLAYIYSMMCYFEQAGSAETWKQHLHASALELSQPVLKS
jgi:hypothetical protein